MKDQRTPEQKAEARAKALRWAKRIPRERSVINKKRCQRQLVRALLSATGPRTDGSDPLGEDEFQLEGI